MKKQKIEIIQELYTIGKITITCYICCNEFICDNIIFFCITWPIWLIVYVLEKAFKK